MDKLGDMDLFVRVVRNKGLAAAGREVGLSPARMTARMNQLEERYGVRLLHRTTRRTTLTEEGQEFYEACLRILASVGQAEAELTSGRDSFAGPLRLTTSVDLGRQYVAPLLDKFVRQHPGVMPFMLLSDGLVDLGDRRLDLGVRYGVLEDSSMIFKRLASSSRVLCASPDYLNARGAPKSPEDLSDHDCLTMVRGDQPLTTWHFESRHGKQSVLIRPARSANDGYMIREWALAGAGIALKSTVDVAADLNAGRLLTVMNDWTHDFERKGTSRGADLHVVYPSRDHVPRRVRGFIDALSACFADVVVPLKA